MINVGHGGGTVVRNGKVHSVDDLNFAKWKNNSWLNSRSRPSFSPSTKVLCHLG